ncbi:MAG: 50S ribosome-binding GTPase [Oligoflexia bacterium]|nr:50S ribosome-binding GTPase [Oligoflexia bacterium]
MSDDKDKIVSIVGRPNVGKSTLFNRLLHKAQLAITADTLGVTRDLSYANTAIDEIAGKQKTELILVDTGGFYPSDTNTSTGTGTGTSAKHLSQEKFWTLVKVQSERAIKESDLVLLVVDAREGLLPDDLEFARAIRESEKKFFIVINKCDSDKQRGLEHDYWKLGISPDMIYVVSAAHGRGIQELKEGIQNYFNPPPVDVDAVDNQAEARAEICSLAIIGAPNAGKSTLLNRLLGYERALVSDIPGTTRDPVEGTFDLYFDQREMEILRSDAEDAAESTDSAEASASAEGAPSAGDNRWSTVKVVDTAGIRRKRDVSDLVESEAVIRAMRAVAKADVVLLLVDATTGITHQDKRLAEIALEKGRSLLVLLNKIDLLADLRKEKYKWKEWQELQRSKFPWSYCQTLFLSAKSGECVGELKRALKATIIIRLKKISTPRLNNGLQRLVERQPLMIRGGGVGGGRLRMLKIKYASMVKMDPPTVLIFSNLAQGIPAHYRRYLSNGIREEFKLRNTPVHIIFRCEH